MLEAVGDLWKLPADVRCVTTNAIVKTNGRAVMGRGVAQQARDKFRGVDLYLGELLKSQGNHVHLLHVDSSREWDLVSFPVKHHFRYPAIPELILRSCAELMLLADQHPEWQRILLPRPGCGAGELSWEDVRGMISPVLDDRVLVIDRAPSLGFAGEVAGEGHEK